MNLKVKRKESGNLHFENIKEMYIIAVHLKN